MGGLICGSNRIEVAQLPLKIGEGAWLVIRSLAVPVAICGDRFWSQWPGKKWQIAKLVLQSVGIESDIAGARWNGSGIGTWTTVK